MYTGNLIGGRYRVTRRIGAGAIGVVWEAEDTQSERRVALKQVLHAAKEHQRRLLKEARVCQRLSHPNIIEVLDVGETERGVPFLVMPLLSGETIAEMLLRKRKLAIPLAARIARDIANALAAAHADGIIHRDLKPANVFIHRPDKTESPIVKVLDFGVCKDANAKTTILTAQGHVIGSPAYMSPEQVKGAELDARTDIWSLGVVLFEMITGVRPFRGQGVVELFVNILGAEIPTISQLVRTAPPGLASLVSGCLTRDRERRVGSAREVAAMLDEYVSADGTSTLTETSCHLLERALGDAAARGSPAPSPPSAAIGSPPSASEAWDPALSNATTTPFPRRPSGGARPLTGEGPREAASGARGGGGGTELLERPPRAFGRGDEPAGGGQDRRKSLLGDGSRANAPFGETLVSGSSTPSPVPQGSASAGSGPGAEGLSGGAPRRSAGAPGAAKEGQAPVVVARGGALEMDNARLEVARGPSVAGRAATPERTLPPSPRDCGGGRGREGDADLMLALPGDLPMDLPRSTWITIGVGAMALGLLSLGFVTTLAGPSEPLASTATLVEPPLLKSVPPLPAPAEATRPPAPSEPPPPEPAVAPTKKSTAAPATRAAILQPPAKAPASQARPAVASAGKPPSLPQPVPQTKAAASPPAPGKAKSPARKESGLIGGSKAPF